MNLNSPVSPKNPSDSSESSDDIFYIEQLYTEKARQLASEISNETARKILRELYKNPSSITDLSEKLRLPISTVQHHIGKLLEIGVISIAERKIGRRMRDVKLYVYNKESIIFLSSMERSEFESLLKTYTMSKIKKKAPIISIIIFVIGFVISFIGSWLLKKEFERLLPQLPFVIAGEEMEIWKFFAILSISFLGGVLISFSLFWLIFRDKN